MHSHPFDILSDLDYWGLRNVFQLSFNGGAFFLILQFLFLPVQSEAVNMVFKFLVQAAKLTMAKVLFGDFQNFYFPRDFPGDAGK